MPTSLVPPPPADPTPTDAEADDCSLQRLLGGDLAGLAEIAQRHDRALRRYCRRFPDADDVVQAVWVRLMSSPPQHFTGTGAMPWLVRVARNAAIDTARHTARRAQLAKRATAEAATRAVVAGCETTVVAADAAADVLGQLAPGDRQLLVDAYVNDVPLADLATDAGVSVSAVKMRISRVKARCKAYGERALGVLLPGSWLARSGPLLEPSGHALAGIGAAAAGVMITAGLLLPGAAADAPRHRAEVSTSTPTVVATIPAAVTPAPATPTPEPATAAAPPPPLADLPADVVPTDAAVAAPQQGPGPEVTVNSGRLDVTVDPHPTPGSHHLEVLGGGLNLDLTDTNAEEDATIEQLCELLELIPDGILRCNPDPGPPDPTVEVPATLQGLPGTEQDNDAEQDTGTGQ